MRKKLVSQRMLVFWVFTPGDRTLRLINYLNSRQAAVSVV